MLLRIFFRVKKKRQHRRIPLKKFKELYPQKTLLQGSRRHYLVHRERAREIIAERLEYFCNRYGFAYNRVSIRNQKTRWGSCSRKGNLNFNYRLLFLPPALRDYIIVHELAHVREHNHLKHFWQAVEVILPHFRELTSELHNFVIL